MSDNSLNNGRVEGINGGWKQSPWTFWSIIALCVVIMGWSWVDLLPAAMNGEEYSIGGVLVGFGLLSVVFSILAMTVNQGKPGIVVAWGFVVGFILFGFSFLLDKGVGGDTIGLAVRTAGLITIAQSGAFWSLTRNR